MTVKAATDAEIAEIAERHKRATPGPWYHRQAGMQHPEVERYKYDWIADHPEQGRHKKIIVQREACYGGEPDYAFIAHSWADIPALLARIAQDAVERKRLEMKLAAIREFAGSLYAECVSDTTHQEKADG